MAPETVYEIVEEGELTYQNVYEHGRDGEIECMNPQYKKFISKHLVGGGSGKGYDPTKDIYNKYNEYKEGSQGRDITARGGGWKGTGNNSGYYTSYHNENKVQKIEPLSNQKIGNIVADAYVGAGTNNYSTSNFPLALELKDIITIGLPVSISFPLSIPILLMSATAIIPGDTPIDRPQVLAVPNNGWNWHHIATDKYLESEPFWTARFEELFNEVGMNLSTPFNIVPVFGHKGRHPQEYHQEVFDKLNASINSTRGFTLATRQNLFRMELMKLAVECVTPGTRLNSLLIK